MPRGGRRSNPGGRPRSPDPRQSHPVYLTSGERRRYESLLEPAESWQDFAREALATLPRVRAVIAEIERLIADCRKVEQRYGGTQAEVSATQRRTLEHVLTLLKPPAKRRSQLQGGG